MRGGSIRWLVFQKEGQIVAGSLLYDNLVIYQGILHRVRHQVKEAGVVAATTRTNKRRKTQLSNYLLLTD